MEKEMKPIFGIALLFTIVTSVFSLLANLAFIGFVYPQSNLRSIASDFSWLIVVAMILIYLLKRNKRLDQSIKYILSNQFIRQGTAVLLIIHGLMACSNVIPNEISNIQPLFQLAGMDKVLFLKDFSYEVGSLLIAMGSIIVGAFLIKLKKDLTFAPLDEGRKTIFGIAFLFTLVTSIFSLLERLAKMGNSHSNQGQAYWFIYFYGLWIVVTGAIIVFLLIYNRKLKQNIKSIIAVQVIKKGAGILVVIDGLTGLSIILIPGYSIVYIVLLCIRLCQIIVGLVLIKYDKKGANSV